MKRVIIIAEAGVNHNGDLEIARKLIDAAADAGADYVKFQTFKANKLVSKAAVKADYQARNLNDGDNSQFAMLKKLEMPESWHFDLQQYAMDKGISFLSTGFDIDSVDFLDQLGVPFFKIPSGEITNKPYLENIAKKGKHIALSTGMADIDEIKAAMDVITANGISKDMITVLHCNTEYPTPMSDVNLLAMLTIKRELDIKIGYSDHTLGIEVSLAAVALGATIIEKTRPPRILRTRRAHSNGFCYKKY
jgi:N,N'-diacetyllegionaminate synthase